MGTETANPGDQPQQSPPGQDIPKTGRDPRDPSEPIERDVQDDGPTRKDDDDDEDETGKIKLPGESGGDDQADRSRSADNP